LKKINFILIFLIFVSSCQKQDGELITSSGQSTTSDNLGQTAPQVYSVSPDENSFLISVKTPVSIMFSREMDAGSITTNTSSNSCSGTIQLSPDNFSTCVRMSESPSDSEGKTTFNVVPVNDLLHSTNYKIRVKNTAKDKNGISLEADYTSEKGFTTISLRDESFGTSIQCDARPLKASPVVESLNIFANNSKDFTGLELNWSPLIGATRYGLKIDLISENKYFKEIDALSCTNIKIQLDSSISNLRLSGCVWSGPYFSSNSKHGFTVNAYNQNGKLIASSKDNATVGVDKPTPPLEVWGTVGDTEVTLEWNSVQGISGYKIYQLDSGTFKDITPSGLGLLTKTTITGLTNGTEYEFRLKSINSDGSSQLSNPVKLKPSYGRDYFLIKYDSSGTKIWTKQYGTSSDEWVSDINTDVFGNIFLTGHTDRDLDGSLNEGGNDLYLIKYNSSGGREWTRQIGSNLHDYGRSLVTDSSGNIYVAGHTYGGLDNKSNSGGSDIFTIKYNSSGIKQGVYQSGSSYNDYLTSIAIDQNGYLHGTGFSYGNIDNQTNLGSTDVFTGKLKWDSFETLWSRHFGTKSTDRSKKIGLDSLNNVYVTGITEGDFNGKKHLGKEDVFLIKYDSSGLKKWTRQIGSSASDNVEDLYVDSNGNVYITGGSKGSLDNNSNAGSYDIFLMKFNTSGEKQWTRQWGTSEGDGAYGIDVDSFGNIYVTGSTYGDLDGNTNKGKSDLFLTKYNSSGSKQWTKQVGTTSMDWAQALSSDSSGNIYVSGVTAGDLDGNKNAGRNAVSLKFDKVTANQSVQHDFSGSNQPKLISDKPGIIRAFLKLSGNISGYLGTIRLSGAGGISSVDPITQTIAIYDTPQKTADESNCVATFDLRSVASSWFKTGAEIILETNSGSIIDSSASNYVRYPESGSQKINVVEQEPLFIKLVPIQTEKGKLSQSEMDVSKTKIQSLMNSMYPNSSITFEVASTHYDITNTDEYENLEKYESWSSALNGFKSLRDLELNNTNCNRFYYGLVKDDDDIKFAVGGLAKRTTSVEKNSCPSLVGMGLNSKNVAEIAAHEIGHNSGRKHADNSGEINDRCKDPQNNDSGYPYQFGRIGKMGYDSNSNSLRSKYFYHDIMSYCDHVWVSDYNYIALQEFQTKLNQNVASRGERNQKLLSENTLAGGFLISGIKFTDGEWKIDSILSLGGSRIQPKNPTHVMILTTKSGTNFSQKFALEWFDHVLDRPFSVWIPSTESISRIRILNLDGDLLFEKDYSSLEDSSKKIGELKLKKVSEGFWQLYPSNQGRRIVILVQDSQRRFVGNDNDEESLNFKAAEGDKIEIHYPDKGVKRLISVE